MLTEEVKKMKRFYWIIVAVLTISVILTPLIMQGQQKGAKYEYLVLDGNISNSRRKLKAVLDFRPERGSNISHFLSRHT